MGPFKRPHGQGLVEYALVIVLVAVIVLIVLSLFGVGIGNMFSNVIANF
jgi:pilus assembly protein Flp/PilA